jgi:hypothetical protein
LFSFLPVTVPIRVTSVIPFITASDIVNYLLLVLLPKLQLVIPFSPKAQDSESLVRCDGTPETLAVLLEPSIFRSVTHGTITPDFVVINCSYNLAR